MSLLEAIVLAVVQGVTEFLPISSTAHLILVPWLFGWHDPGLTYDIALHAGTLVAVLAYFARDWTDLVVAALRRLAHFVSAHRSSEPDLSNPPSLPSSVQLNFTLLLILAVGTVPAALAGYFLERYAESAFRSPWLVASALMGVALLMWVADRRSTLARAMETVGFKDGLLIGLAQAVAIVPGTSRAGITIAAGLFRNLTRESAARFSFLLATPIIAGATLKKALELRHEALPPGVAAADFAVGFAVSALVGYAAIAFLLRYLQVRTLKIFVAYRLVLGVIIVAIGFLRSSPH